MFGMNEGEIILTAVGLSMIMISLGVTFALVVKAVRGSSGRSSTPAGDEDETRMIQEIYHGLTKMEDRIESLETLLIDSEKRRSEKRKLSEFDRDMERS
jgi:hypothetical protein